MKRAAAANLGRRTPSAFDDLLSESPELAQARLRIGELDDYARSAP